MIRRPPISTESDWTCNTAVHRGGETTSPQRQASYDGTMELGLSAIAHGDLARRATPIAVGGALAVSCAFVATHNPASPGARYPTCAFHQATGLWCPGCGLTRGVYQLLHGHIGAALGYNIFTPVAIAAIAITWFGWLRVSWGAPPLRVPPRAGRWFAIVMPVLLLIYGVLRNVPVAPLRALAP